METNGTKQSFRVWVQRSDKDRHALILSYTDFDDDVHELKLDPDAGPRTWAIVTPSEKLLLPLHLSRVHLMRGGFRLLMQGLREEITPPYLITNLLGIQAVDDKEVEMTLSARARELFAQDGHDDVYPVETNEWFGILTTRSDGRVHLRAFSENATAKIRNDQSVSFAGWCDFAPAGVIRI